MCTLRPQNDIETLEFNKENTQRTCTLHIIHMHMTPRLFCPRFAPWAIVSELQSMQSAPNDPELSLTLWKSKRSWYNVHLLLSPEVSSLSLYVQVMISTIGAPLERERQLGHRNTPPVDRIVMFRASRDPLCTGIKNQINVVSLWLILYSTFQYHLRSNLIVTALPIYTMYICDLFLASNVIYSCNHNIPYWRKRLTVQDHWRSSMIATDGSIYLLSCQYMLVVFNSNALILVLSEI